MRNSSGTGGRGVSTPRSPMIAPGSPSLAAVSAIEQLASDMAQMLTTMSHPAERDVRGDAHQELIGRVVSHFDATRDIDPPDNDHGAAAAAAIAAMSNGEGGASSFSFSSLAMPSSSLPSFQPSPVHASVPSSSSSASASSLSSSSSSSSSASKSRRTQHPALRMDVKHDDLVNERGQLMAAWLLQEASEKYMQKLVAEKEHRVSEFIRRENERLAAARLHVMRHRTVLQSSFDKLVSREMPPFLRLEEEQSLSSPSSSVRQGSVVGRSHGRGRNEKHRSVSMFVHPTYVLPPAGHSKSSEAGGDGASMGEKESGATSAIGKQGGKGNEEAPVAAAVALLDAGLGETQVVRGAGGKGSGADDGMVVEEADEEEERHEGDGDHRNEEGDKEDEDEDDSDGALWTMEEDEPLDKTARSHGVDIVGRRGSGASSTTYDEDGDSELNDDAALLSRSAPIAVPFGRSPLKPTDSSESLDEPSAVQMKPPHKLIDMQTNEVFPQGRPQERRFSVF